MLRCKQLPSVLPPPAPSPPSDVMLFDDLLTSSMQSDEPASAFDPIPGSVPDRDNDPGTEPSRDQMPARSEQQSVSERVARSRSLSEPDHMMTHAEWVTSIADSDQYNYDSDIASSDPASDSPLKDET
eukprot:8599979-Karenia_brevis.AAC.1